MKDELKFISIGYHKGEMDFGVNASIGDLSIEEFNQLRIMTIVAIGQAENMWRDARYKMPENQAAQTSTPPLKSNLD